MTQAFADYDFEDDEPARLVRIIDGIEEDDETTVLLPTTPSMIFTIGRNPGCSLLLHDTAREAENKPAAVSSMQAEIVQLQNGMYVLRIRSQNAFTFVNELPQKINAVPAYTPPDIPLADGDILRIGGGQTEAEHYDRFVYKVVAPDAMQPDRESTPSTCQAQ